MSFNFLELSLSDPCDGYLHRLVNHNGVYNKHGKNPIYLWNTKPKNKPQNKISSVVSSTF